MVATETSIVERKKERTLAECKSVLATCCFTWMQLVVKSHAQWNLKNWWNIIFAGCKSWNVPFPCALHQKLAIHGAQTVMWLLSSVTALLSTYTIQSRKMCRPVLQWHQCVRGLVAPAPDLLSHFQRLQAAEAVILSTHANARNSSSAARFSVYSGCSPSELHIFRTDGTTVYQYEKEQVICF